MVYTFEMLDESDRTFSISNVEYLSHVIWTSTVLFHLLV